MISDVPSEGSFPKAFWSCWVPAAFRVLNRDLPISLSYGIYLEKSCSWTPNMIEGKLLHIPILLSKGILADLGRCDFQAVGMTLPPKKTETLNP